MVTIYVGRPLRMRTYLHAKQFRMVYGVRLLLIAYCYYLFTKWQLILIAINTQ